MLTERDGAVDVGRYCDQVFRDPWSEFRPRREFFVAYRDGIATATGDVFGRMDSLFGWLSEVALDDPPYALEVLETAIDGIDRIYTSSDAATSCAKCLTELFREAEDCELSDDGRFLKRVLAVQDVLFSIGLDALDEWLRAAERP